MWQIKWWIDVTNLYIGFFDKSSDACKKNVQFTTEWLYTWDVCSNSIVYKLSGACKFTTNQMVYVYVIQLTKVSIDNFKIALHNCCYLS